MENINDLPLDLIQKILLRLPVKSLLQLRCVCKAWLHLISDPNFAKSHFQLAAAPTRRCLFVQSSGLVSYDMDALFDDGHAAVKVSLPCKNPYRVLESCRGFILLDNYPHFIIWNPSTGAHKRISYSHIMSLRSIKRFQLLGFGYDTSKDDYLVVVSWRARKKDHFDFFSLRTDSWKSFKVDLPNPLMDSVWRCGLFLNGAFHWLACPHQHDDPILIFDPKERSFSGIPLPERAVISGSCRLMELGGCLALYYWSKNNWRPEIWVMKEYKVYSSWTLYEIFDTEFLPICLSNYSDIVGFDGYVNGFDIWINGFSKYNVSGQQLEHFSCQQFRYDSYTMYTESLLPLPNDAKNKKNGHEVCQEWFEQLDAVANHNHKEVKERKRIRSAPTWTCDFYCN